jgi:hypothetical protein
MQRGELPQRKVAEGQREDIDYDAEGDKLEKNIYSVLCDGLIRFTKKFTWALFSLLHVLFIVKCLFFRYPVLLFYTSFAGHRFYTYSM